MEKYLVLLMGEPLMKQIKSAAAHTFVNPLPMPCIPRGKDEWYPYEHGMFSHENKPASVTGADYRSISDPTVFYHGGEMVPLPQLRHGLGK